MMKVVREYNLSDEPGHIREPILWQLNLLMFFPDDEETLNINLDLLFREYARWEGQGRPLNYEPTKAARDVFVKSTRAVGRRITAGLVALAYCGLDKLGQNMSLERASSVVHEFSNSRGKIPMWFSWDGQKHKRDVALLGDQSSIKQAFREYRPVAHLIAAFLVADEYMDPEWPMFHSAPELERCILNTMFFIESRLKKVSNFDDWNTWHIVGLPDYDPRDFPPFDPTSFTQQLFMPWLNKNNMI